jgi:hypothetical protein
MQVRAYQDSDLEELKRIHAAQRFDYPFPDLSNPLFLTKLTLLEDEASPDKSDGSSAGQGILGAALLRLTAEAYLLLDPKLGTPRERWNGLLRLHAAAELDAARRGLEDVHAWLPPPLAAKFGKRLTRLGWVRDDVWTPYCKRFVTSDHEEVGRDW